MKKPILPLLCLLLLAGLVSAAINVDINIKPSFRAGEEISFNYLITSSEDLDLLYIVGVDCLKAPSLLLDYRRESLKKDIPFSGEKDYITITEGLEPQTCLAYLEIRSPFKQRFEESFKIETAPSFDFSILFCKDSACTETSKVFVKDETVYLNYESSVSEPDIKATLTLPNKTTQQASLPTSIKAEQIGTYMIEVETSKEGYKTMRKSEQFGVIKEKAEIEYLEDRMRRERAAGTPEKLEKKAPSKFPLEYLIAVLVIIIIITILILFWIKRKRKSQIQVVPVEK